MGSGLTKSKEWKMKTILATLDNWMSAEEISGKTGYTKALISQTIKWRNNGRVEVKEVEIESERSRTFSCKLYRKTRQTILTDDIKTRQQKFGLSRLVEESIEVQGD
jgi:hypothetical protein